MESFLQKLAQHLHEQYAEKLNELYIVFPNKRAGLFFKNELAKILQKTAWLPEISSSEDLILELSSLQIIDTTELLSELYLIHKTLKKKNFESFENYSKWAGILLQDFSEIDTYLADTQKLFQNLSDVKEIENWSFGADSLTEMQKKYSFFWEDFGKYYEALKLNLLQQNKAYKGLAYRVVAENITQKITSKNAHKFIFAGFNAFNAAEEKIIETLVKSNKGELFWDVDTYYTDDPMQEAGKFIREYKKKFGYETHPEKFLFSENQLSETAKKITLLGVPKNVAQAKIAGGILSEKKTFSEQDFEKTVLVLADENLIFPVLNSLPENVCDVNITMGYPLKNTSFNTLFELIFKLHDITFKRAEKFYFKDVLNLLSHPYLKSFSARKKNIEAHYSIIDLIKKENFVFISVEKISAVLNDDQKKYFQSLQPLFKEWKNGSDVLNCLNYLVELTSEIVDDKENNERVNLESEFLSAFKKIIFQTQNLREKYSFLNEPKTLQTIFRQTVNSTQLPFYGEPLKGLQIMGMLETRNLDFETIILLSANENILPSKKSSNSFIPFDLRKRFGLPTYADRDAVYAYLFYRLLQRAKTVYLLYNTEADTFGNGEKSRFITQLMYELVKKSKAIEIEERKLDTSKNNFSTEEKIVVEKTVDILERLDKKAESGFSPSLLNTYKRCSLQFYFQLIAGLKKEEEVSETIEADTLGTAIHKVLQVLYTPHIGNKISESEIKNMKLQVESVVFKALSEYYHPTDLAQGKNFITLKMAEKYIRDFLNKELENIKKQENENQFLFIQALEKSIEATLFLENKKIKIKGIADRIDSVGGCTRIIDYKTGKAEDKELRMDNLTEIGNNITFAKSFQLLMYALMYQHSNPEENKKIQSAVISFRQLSAWLKPVSVAQNKFIEKNTLDEFEMVLKNLFLEIYNPEIPFKQTEDLEICQYCDFKTICHR
ncbi:MAG: PD-(D/E)XK nuclease family protein [Bacteroidia bacterium]